MVATWEGRELVLATMRPGPNGPFMSTTSAPSTLIALTVWFAAGRTVEIVTVFAAPMQTVSGAMGTALRLQFAATDQSPPVAGPTQVVEQEAPVGLKLTINA